MDAAFPDHSSLPSFSPPLQVSRNEMDGRAGRRTPKVARRRRTRDATREERKLLPQERGAEVFRLLFVSPTWLREIYRGRSQILSDDNTLETGGGLSETDKSYAMMEGEVPRLAIIGKKKGR